MNKNDKKTENKIVRALNSVCDILKFDIEGFCWLTHFVDYANVPQSLRIVVVFDTDLSLANAKGHGLEKTITALAGTHLVKEGFVIAHIEQAIFFDTEENGAEVENSKWCRKYV